MDSHDIRNLQESYLNIYDPIQRELDYYIDELIEEGYDINEYSDEELLESFLIERKNQDPKGIAYKAGINKPDDWGPPTPFGQAATRGSLARGIQGVRSLKQRGVRINRHHRNKYLAYKVHQGWSGAAQNSPHQTEAQKERRGKLIQPDLLSFRTNLPKRERDKDVPFVKKAERAANGRGEFASDSTPPQTERQKRLAKLQQAQRERNASRGVSETYDIYDEILEYLLDEGYANCLGSAEIIVENMSEEWLYDILEGAINDLRRKHGLKSGDSIAQKISDRALKLSRQRKGQTPERKKKYEYLSTTAWRRANPLPTRHPSGRENMDQEQRDRRRDSDVDYWNLHRIPPSTKKHGRFTQGKGSLPKGKKLYQHVIRGMIPPEMSSKIDPFVLLQSAAGKKSNINAEFELWVNELINEGYDLSEHTLDDMYKLYEASGGVIGGRFFRKKKSLKPGQKKI